MNENDRLDKKIYVNICEWKRKMKRIYERKPKICNKIYLNNVNSIKYNKNTCKSDLIKTVHLK